MPFPVDAQFIDAAETKLGIRLPLAYRARLARLNGGELAAGGDVWQLFPVRDSSDRKRIARTCNDVTAETASAREWTGFPPEAVALGSNGSGDFLILCPDGDDAGILGAELFWWDHETGDAHLIAADVGDLL